MKRWICSTCGFLYDEAIGYPEAGIPAGTRWDDIHYDWICPDCGEPKSSFQMEPA